LLPVLYRHMENHAELSPQIVKIVKPPHSRERYLINEQWLDQSG